MEFFSKINRDSVYHKKKVITSFVCLNIWFLCMEKALYKNYLLNKGEEKSFVRSGDMIQYTHVELECIYERRKGYGKT